MKQETAGMGWRGVVMFTALLAAGCTKHNPDYCEQAADCSNGDVCDLTTHGCVPGSDAGTDATAPDATAPAPACDVNKPFGPATEVPGLHDPMANDVHPTLTGNELTVYFASNRYDHSTTMHIYRANRLTRDTGFGAPTLVSSLSTVDGEQNPSVTSDGNTIYFDTYRANVGALLQTSKRADATVVFPPATTLSNQGLVQPSITADGKALYVTNQGTGLLARLQNLGDSFGPPQDVETQLAYTQVSPATSDELTLFLTRRNGALQVTKRTSTTVSWPTPTEVTELNTHDEEVLPSWVSPDGCRLYVTYTPTGARSRIYMATRPK